MDIQKQMISSQVSSYLRDQIMHSKLKPGERIVESKIAKVLGISQAPVREALRELEGMGFVEIKPYVGCCVLPIDETRIKDAYDIRALLESYAGVRAMGIISEEQLEQMRMLLKQMNEDADSEDMQTLVEHDVQFHSVMMEAADNPLLMKLWRITNVQQWSSLTMLYSDDYRYFADSHQMILEALEKKDASLLRVELEKHFANAAEMAIGNVSKLRPDEQKGSSKQ